MGSTSDTTPESTKYSFSVWLRLRPDSDAPLQAAQAALRAKFSPECPEFGGHITLVPSVLVDSATVDVEERRKELIKLGREAVQEAVGEEGNGKY